MEWTDFILAHEGEDLGKLALARDRYAAEVEDFDLALTTLEVRRKLRDKVPQWYAVLSLRYPLRVSGEQCSSTETARYKAAVASAAAMGRLADLTGGLGVDSWAFAQVFDQVLYNEMRPELADAARHNFAALGLDNVRVTCSELVAERHPVKPGVTESACPCPSSSSCPTPIGHLLGDFRPDILFLDPARRASDGRKVFRLEDCQPDVLQLLPELLAACPRVLLKLSPMADISLVCKQLGCVKAVHVVGAEGECKELLILLERDYAGPHSLTVYANGAVAEISAAMHGETLDQVGGDGCVMPDPFHVMPDPFHVMPDPDRASPAWLFDPGKALLKAGAFTWPCQYGLQKLGQHTHAYVSAQPVDALKPFGKWYRILEVTPLNNRSIKEIGRRYPGADVTARNIPITSEALRAKLSKNAIPLQDTVPNQPPHVFGLHIDATKSNYLLVCALLK